MITIATTMVVDLGDNKTLNVSGALLLLDIGFKAFLSVTLWFSFFNLCRKVLEKNGSNTLVDHDSSDLTVTVWAVKTFGDKREDTTLEIHFLSAPHFLPASVFFLSRWGSGDTNRWNNWAWLPVLANGQQALTTCSHSQQKNRRRRRRGRSYVQVEMPSCWECGSSEKREIRRQWQRTTDGIVCLGRQGSIGGRGEWWGYRGSWGGGDRD